MNTIKHTIAVTILSLFLVTSLMISQDMVSFQNRRGATLTARIEKTGSASRIFGISDNISLFGYSRQSLNEETIDDLGKKIIDDYAGILKISSASLLLKRADTDGMWWFVRYQQAVGGVPIYGSEIGFTVDPRDILVSLGATAYPGADVAVKPQILAAEAIRVAKDVFQAANSKLESAPQLVILPQEKDSGFSFSLCWVINLQAVSPLKEYIFFVNAVDGTVLKEMDNLMESDIYGTVSGYYWPVRNYDTPVTGTFQTNNVKVYNYLGQLVATRNTDANGYWSVTGLSYSYYTVRMELQNNWIMVRDQAQGGDPVQVNVGTYPGQFNYTWAANDGPNVRRHASYIHDFFKASPFNYSGMDYQMNGYVNDGPGTNGGANGTNIFFGSDAGQQWARSSDVVFHEYTHNVAYHVYAGWIGGGPGDYYSQGAAMDEGLSDYFACTNNNDATLGEDVGVSRNLDNNTYAWNPNLTKYYNCQVIGGSIWDLRQAVGQGLTDNLAFKSMQITPSARTFADYLYNMLIADKSNYAAAYHQQILNAFQSHGITVPAVTVSISGPSEVWHSQKGDPANQYTWSANISGGRTPFSYVWMKDGIQVGSNSSSFIDYFGFNGYNDGSYQFSLQVNVTDAGAQTASADNTVTAYNSGEGIPPAIGDFGEVALALPDQFSVRQNYPNPFNPETEISFALPEPSAVRITILDVLGREILMLTDREYSAGYQRVTWRGTDGWGNKVGSGVYFYRVIATGQSGKQFTRVMKMALTK